MWEALLKGSDDASCSGATTKHASARLEKRATPAGLCLLSLPCARAFRLGLALPLR